MFRRILPARGFTLFEVLLIIGIVGLLSTIALPALRSYTVRSSFSVPDAALSYLLRQHMAFTAPTWMPLGSRATVEVAIGGDKSVAELVNLLKPSGQTGGELVKVSERMAARLVAPGFTVTPVSAEIQEVSRKEPTVWKWSIEANDTGKQPIYLSVDALYSVDGKDAARSSSLEKTIIVEVESWDARWAWIRHNWTFVAFLLTALSGLGAFLLNRKRAAK